MQPKTNKIVNDLKMFDEITVVRDYVQFINGNTITRSLDYFEDACNVQCWLSTDELVFRQSVKDLTEIKINKTGQTVWIYKTVDRPYTVLTELSSEHLLMILSAVEQ